MRKSDRQHEFFDFRNAGQQAAGQDFVILADFADQFCQDQTINQTGRMIGHHNNRSGCRYFGDLLLRSLHLDLHQLQGTGKKGLSADNPFAFKLADQAQ